MSLSVPAATTATAPSTSTAKPTVAQLVELLAAERAHATRAWTILSELRLHGVLPDWAIQAGAGSYDAVTGQSAARQALNEALAAVLPGFREAQQNALGIPRLTRFGD